MPASAQTRYYHSSSPGTASGDVTGMTVRFKLADDDVQNTQYPIPLPLSPTGLSLSWRKSSKVNFVTSPGGAILNLRWFLATLPATGVNFFARTQLPGIYVTATAADQNGIPNFTDTTPNQGANNAAQYTSLAPLVVQSGTVLSNPNVGEGNQVFVETQLGLLGSYSGGQGPGTPFQITYRYSET